METESGFEVESLNAAEGRRLPLPSLRRLVVPTQPPITMILFLTGCLYHDGTNRAINIDIFFIISI